MKLRRIVTYYAVHSKHIGLYPGVAAIRAFAGELKGYNTSKGTVQLPLDKKLPIGLIARMMKFAVKVQKET